MWLLNTQTITLRNFMTNIPDYVILSHTWGLEEVTFDIIHIPDQCTKLEGYNKILGCCRKAVEDGFDWVWIDTCCIDKRSSAELSEAINSMYKWYWDAAICYAYLQDVSDLPAPPDIGPSKWFTRGWTLQELIAPSHVEFYTQSWSFIGTKAGLLKTLQSITKIDEEYLEDRGRVRLASIATRFSWASERKTTREEDMAYCLLGLVGINMPMLYGEGRRAFHRLQLEILKKTNDHTIFAWEIAYSGILCAVGVLAPSPSNFRGSAGIRAIRAHRPAESLTHEVTNNGLKISLPMIKYGIGEFIALLHCENSEGRRLGIRLINLENENQQYGRSIKSKNIEECSEESEENSSVKPLHLLLDSEEEPERYALHTATHIGLGYRLDIRDVRGNCGYKIASIMIQTGTWGVIEADPPTFWIENDYLICVNIGTTVWNPRTVTVLLGFSSAGHMVFYTSESDLDIGEAFLQGWSADLFTSRSSQAVRGAGIDRLRVVLNGSEPRALMEVKSKKCLKRRIQVWVVSIQIIKCVCSPRMDLHSNNTTCTCEFPPFREDK